MPRKVPERIRWAVETFAIAPGDRVLEIGCGSGVAAALVCEQLGEGSMLAIDRSQIQVERARVLNEAHVVAGRLSLEAASIEELDAGDRLFDKVFAVNVNAFWTGSAERELASVGRVLAHGGRLFLFYETPEAARAREASERIAANLDAAGFMLQEVLTPAPARLGLIAAPRGAPSP